MLSATEMVDPTEQFFNSIFFPVARTTTALISFPKILLDFLSQENLFCRLASQSVILILARVLEVVSDGIHGIFILPIQQLSSILRGVMRAKAL